MSYVGRFSKGRDVRPPIGRGASPGGAGGGAGLHATPGRARRSIGRARSCPRQGGIEPLHMLTTLGLKSSPNPSWNKRRPVAREGVLANMRRCTSDLRTARRKFLPQRSRLPRQTASFKGLAAQSACPGLSPVARGAL